MATNPEKEFPRTPQGINTPKITTELSRNLKLIHVTMMGVGMMIGAGVFLGMGNADKSRGSGRGDPHLCAERADRDIHGHVLCRAEFSDPQGRRRLQFCPDRVWPRDQFYCRMDGVVCIIGCREPVCGHLRPVHRKLPFPARYHPRSRLSADLIEKTVAVLIACCFLYINFRGVSETGNLGRFSPLGRLPPFSLSPGG